MQTLAVFIVNVDVNVDPKTIVILLLFPIFSYDPLNAPILLAIKFPEI